MKTAFPFLFCFFFLSACATYTTQFADKDAPKKVISSNYEENKVSHTIYLIGDAGNAPMGETLPTLEYLKEHLEDASENSSLVFWATISIH
ncbi:hypothetical protein [Tenacibaculum sp. SG-28]|uniref:hypothetical protein n=1 Tax=Tenacibaculum sp. SG-28 TaxID=754426 RepID=UPI000CF5347E|nr:hypothetical protein [Tenacibaculum sp. SG-28]